MESSLSVRQGNNYATAIIKTTAGTEFRVTVLDGKDSILVHSVDGALIIKPLVSNEIEVKTTTH
jgi:hypothetical protein